MLGQALVALQVSLVLAALWLGYGLTSTLVRAVETTDVKLPPIEAPEHPSQTLEAYGLISDRDLFHTAQAPAPVVQPTVEIKKSAFAVKLIGTAASPNEDNASVAILESNVSGNKMVVRVGDPLFGATVDSIDRKRVVVKNQGRLEEIVPPEKGKPGKPRAKGKGKRRQLGALAAAAAKARRNRAQSIAPRGPKAVPAKRAPVGLLSTGGLLSQVRLSRVPDGSDSPGAYSVSRLRKGGAAHKAGFEDGDVLVSLNGIELSDAVSTLREIRDADVAETILVEVDRNGQRLTIELEPEDL